MKKVLSIILIICILVLGGGCKRKDMQGGAEAQVAVDPSENDMSHLEIIRSPAALINYGYPTNLEMMEKLSEYIVVASPNESYRDATQVWASMMKGETTDFEEAEDFFSYSKRTFTVDKVLKGEDTDQIVICEDWFSDGKTLKIIEGDYVANKGDKYLMFLFSSANNPNEYYAFLSQGKFNLNGSQTEWVRADILKEIREHPKYKDLFE